MMKFLYLMFMMLFFLGCNCEPCDCDEILDKDLTQTESTVDLSSTKPNYNESTYPSIYIDKDNNYFLGKSSSVIQFDSIERQLIDHLRVQNVSSFNLFGDAKCDWEYATHIIDIAQANQFKIMILTKN